ncbi:xanthine dehydrogenase family protein molybdopterin-binding subunit [Pseudoduganella namucuonensis]|uniref:Isoquinoline 1-oxidoreductase, beta subunit n=1 Tax=Pseudoduganella namucuonensis TaxID=1035707 RepID=A0A1I7JDK7_9BURK|nr:molybdopterin cofactor-binding domain-containing protein [Pseudoduganella namucuonensis]SFU83228.1 isoquinoline 1-oxidoreductase, beta subunit [Pseudoduganella namucuonensis]
MDDHTAISLPRRRFLASSAASALVIAFQLPGAAKVAHAAQDQGFSPNAYLRIGADDSITIIVALVEMGQGTFTSVPMLIAEELEVELSKVKVEPAPADEKTFGHPLYGLQITGGSASIQGAWAKLRQVGATAKQMLVTAAAQTWAVPEQECRAVGGQIIHGPSGRKLSYGKLAAAASRLPVPAGAPLKDPSQFRLVGTSAPRVDTPSKVNGAAQFGIDVKLPGMKVAAIAVCPVIDGTFGSVDDSPAMKVSGVRQVLRSANAIAVVADHYGAAKKGLAALAIKWNEGKSANFSSKIWRAQLATALKGKGVVALNEGSFAKANAAAARRHQAVYESPPLAHTTMEPINCTIHVRKDGCEVWLGTQAPARAQGLVAKAVGMAPERVVVHNFLIGGGFGRKLDADYVETAAHLAKQVDFPLKVVFSREEDIQHDAYRPYFLDEIAAGLDKDGVPVAFSHRTAGSAVIARYAPAWLNKGQDTDAVHTAETPYAVPNKFVEFVRHEPPAGLLTGNWRGVGPTHHAFPNECFIDELAVLAKADPVSYRERLLAKNPRALAVLKLAADKSGWGASLPARQGRGIALVDAWDSCAALVTDVEVGKDGSVKVNRIVCGLDCGIAVNPAGVEAQMESGIVYGLTAALYGTLTFERGRVVQSNFHDYPPLRLNEMPTVEIHLLKSGAKPGGVGEMGTAVAIPSLMNAIYAATRKRLRTYPVAVDQLKA